MTTRNVKDEFAATVVLVKGLSNAERRAAWAGLLAELRREARGDEVAGGASGSWQDAPDSDWEWDLVLANKLDGAYRAVAEEAKALGEGAVSAAKSVGFGLWPLALAAAVVLWAVGQSKGRG